MNNKFIHIEVLSYISAILIAAYFMWYNLEGRFVPEVHSADDGHNHIEELSVEDLINKADEDSTNETIQLDIARILWQKEQFELSYKVYKRFEKHAELNADLLAELGHIYTSMRPNVESVKYFSRSLELDSVNYGALFGMGRLMFEIGKGDMAKSFFEKIIKHHPEREISGIAKEWIEKINNNSNVNSKE